jgi:hypothetical protein
VSAKDREEALRRYVLGTSPEDEGGALDAELSRGGDTFVALEAAEADLLDAYAAGELAPAERGQVEETYRATASGRRRLAFALALHREALHQKALRPRAATVPARRGRVARWLPLAAAIGAIAFGSVLVAWRDHGLRQEIAWLERTQAEAAQRAERLTRQVEASQAEVSRLRAQLETTLREVSSGTAPSGTAPSGTLPRAVAAVVRLVLRPGLLREPSSVPELVLTPDVEWVELALHLPADRYRRYRVALETPEGRSLWRSDLVTAPAPSAGPDLTVRFPAHVIVSGTYVASLTGYGPGRDGSRDGEPAAEYTFRALRIPNDAGRP